MGRAIYYKLSETVAIPCTWYEASKVLADYPGRCLASTLLPNGQRVSTCFLVFDHNLLGHRPVLWNTIVSTPHQADRILGKYSSYQEALDGHDRAVSFLRLMHRS